MVTAIRISALNKTFPGGRKALKDIDLSIEAGEMVALIGASGSGKSTLLRHIAGLMTSDFDSAFKLMTSKAARDAFDLS